MAAYRISKRAEADILAIARYTIETFGENQAKIYHDGFTETFAFLGENPQAVRERLEINPPVRAHRYQSHLIVYEIGEAGAPVILRIVHGSMDWENDG